MTKRNWTVLIAIAVGLNIALLILTRPDEQLASEINNLGRTLVGVEGNRDTLVLSLHFGREQTYDPLNESAATASQLVESLRTHLALVHRRSERNALESQFAGIDTAVRHRNDLASNFATENAAFANSRRYFPTLVTEVTRQLELRGQATEAATLNRLARQITDYGLSDSSESIDSIVGTLQSLRNRAPENLHESFRLVEAHGRLLMETRPRLDGVIHEFLDSSPGTALKSFLDQHQRLHSQSIRFETPLRTSLYFLVGVLAVSGILLYRRARGLAADLQSLNRELEHRIDERTAELSERNQELRREIDSRQRVEEEVRAREVSFRTLSENAPDAVARFDRDLRFVYVNPVAQRAIGRPVEEILGQTRSALGLAGTDLWEPALRRVFATGQSEAFFLQETIGGKVCHLKCRLAAEADANGTVQQVLSVTHDVTELRQATADAQAAHERFHLAVRGSNDGIWDWNLQTNEVYYSDRYKELLGFAQCAASEFPCEFSAWRRRLHEDDITIVDQAVSRHLNHGEPFDVEHRLRHRNGEWRWFRARGQAVRDTTGQPIRMAGSLTDVTDNRQKAAALQHAKDSAELANRAKSDFLATMSHEIRTPMNGIIGFANLLLGTALNEEQQDYAETIKQSGEALTVILNDVLDFSKIEAGKLELENVPFELAKCLRGVTQLMNSRAGEKHLALEVEIDPCVPTVLCGDPARFRQIVLNLLGNAIKFTEQGCVRLTVQLAPNETSLVRVAVTDTGIGITEEQLSRLFQKFTQADSSMTRKFGGTGLGLAICKRLVELMGGQIGVTSEAGHGSTFWFTIPAATTANIIPSATKLPIVPAPIVAPSRPPPVTSSPASRPAPTATASSPTPSSRARILVAEDTLTNRKLISALLNRLGHAHDLVTTGHEAVAHYVAHRYDLVLMDCHMPDLDGFGATERIRTLETEAKDSSTHLPIIAVTANALIGDRERCLAAGMDDYLTKPIRFDELKAIVARWLPSSSKAAA